MPTEDVATIISGVRSKNATSRSEAIRLATEWKGIMRLPNNKQTKTTAHLTLPLYFMILRKTEEGLAAFEASQADPKKKFGGRLFTLLPVKASFTTSYVPISSMFWMSILKTPGLKCFREMGEL